MHSTMQPQRSKERKGENIRDKNERNIYECYLIIVATLKEIITLVIRWRIITSHILHFLFHVKLNKIMI